MKLKLLGFILILLTIGFFVPISNIDIWIVSQLMLVIAISVISYLIVLAYVVEEPSATTIDDVDTLFEQGSGELLLVQNTTDPSHNFLKLTLDRKQIEVATALESFFHIRQSILRGIFRGAIAAPIITFLLIWLHSLILPDDMVLQYVVLGVVVIALVIFILMVKFSFRLEEKKFKEERFLQVRKHGSAVHISALVGQHQVRKDALFRELKVSVPTDLMDEELFITSLTDEARRNLDKFSRTQRFLFNLTTKFVNYPNCIAVNFNSENVKVIDQPVTDEFMENVKSSSFLIFGFHDTELLHTLRRNIITWAG